MLNSCVRQLGLGSVNTIAQSLPVTDELIRQISAINILVKYRIVTPNFNEPELLLGATRCSVLAPGPWPLWIFMVATAGSVIDSVYIYIYGYRLM
jgi:hypothetical protein